MHDGRCLDCRERLYMRLHPGAVVHHHRVDRQTASRKGADLTPPAEADNCNLAVYVCTLPQQLDTSPDIGHSETAIKAGVERARAGSVVVRELEEQPWLGAPVHVRCERNEAVRSVAIGNLAGRR